MNIEFGGGSRPTKKNYKQCDVRSLPGIDFCCKATEICDFIESNSVDNIFSRHFFEHLSFLEGRLFLTASFNILKPGGIVHMILPNILFHIDQWISKRDDKKQFDWSKAGFWGWQKNSEDFHKSGYDKNSLQELVCSLGYCEFEILSDTGPHLNVKFKKPLMNVL